MGAKARLVVFNDATFVRKAGHITVVADNGASDEAVNGDGHVIDKGLYEALLKQVNRSRTNLFVLAQVLGDGLVGHCQGAPLGG